MIEINHITHQLIKQPVSLQYQNNYSFVQLAAGFLLLFFFLWMGINIVIAGLKADENRIFYLLFGTILCLFPLVVILIVKSANTKLIYWVDKDGVCLKNETRYQWKNLQRIVYNTSLYERDENKRFVSVQFIFSDGEAIATYRADNFSTILFLSNNLPVPKKEKSFTYFKN